MSHSHNYLKIDTPVGIFKSHKLQGIKYTAEWCINEFESLPPTEKVVTPVFHLGNDSEFEARLACYPEDGSFYVQFVPIDDGRVLGSFRFSLLNRKAEQVHKLGFDMNKNTFREGFGWGINEYVHFCKSFMADSSIFVNGKLIVMCEITLRVCVTMDGTGNQELSSLALTQPQALCSQLSEDLGSLIGNSDFSDVTLIVNGNEFKAHKVILAARSPVFSRMFKSDMKESTCNIVEITDTDVDVVTSMLIYMYTDKVACLQTLGEELLAAADKYQLDDLKAMCQDSLSENLTVENAAQIFVLADLHHAKKLKAKAIEFITKHKCEVFETTGWKLAKKEHPLILVVAFL